MDDLKNVINKKITAVLANRKKKQLSKIDLPDFTNRYTNYIAKENNHCRKSNSLHGR